MKNLVSLVLLFVLPFNTYAQQDVELPGEVVEQNSKFNTGSIKYLSNVIVKSPGANPKHSDANGKFTLVFVDKPFGNVTTIYASKSGYQLVNNEELKKAAVLGRKVPLRVVMCIEGQLYENQVAYYNIARDAVLASHQKRLAILQQEGRAKDLLIAEMEVEFNQKIGTAAQANELMEKQLQTAEQQARELADKFVRTNLDDESESYQRAFHAFLAEDIDKALRILGSVNLAQRLATNTAEKAKVEALIEENQADLVKRNKQIQQDINQCVFKARLHMLNYEFAEAETLFELALQYDSSNEKLIFEFAFFLQKQNRFNKAITRYEEALRLYRTLAEKNPDAYLPNMATILNNLGNLLSANNELVQAKLHYEEALEIRKGLAEKKPDVFMPDIAQTLINLGVLMKANNEIAQAETSYQEALNIYITLAEKNPDPYLSFVALTLNNLGNLLSKNNEIGKAKLHYVEALKIRRTLAEKKIGDYQQDLAQTLNNFGVFLKRKNEIFEAKQSFEEALEIRKSLAEKNPDVYLPYVAMTLNNLGNLLSKNNEVRGAKLHYEEALRLYKALAEKNPNIYLKQVAASLNNLSGLLAANNELVQAKLHYEEALKLLRVLAEKKPEVYLAQIAMVLDNLGLLFRENNELVQAKLHLKEALEIRKGLAEKNPDIYLSYVAVTLNKLGIVSRDNNELQQAKLHYEEALKIRKSLAEKNPRTYNLELCMTLINIGLFYKDLLKETGDMLLKEEAIVLLEDTRKRLSVYPSSYPIVIKYMQYVDDLTVFFANFTKEEYILYQRTKPITALKEKNAAEPDFHRKVLQQEEIIDLYNQVKKDFPDNPELTKIIASEYGSIAWYQLLDQQFSAAQASAQKGLELDASAEWINANLALALLYQGNLGAAQSIYMNLKDKPYRDATYAKIFLEDLDALEKAGIMYPGVAEIRQLLQQ